MSNIKENPFARYAYADRYRTVNETDEDWNQENNRVVFAGGDLHPYVNNTRVGNLESATWSISTEVVGNYVMGRRDPVFFVQGKRVIVGSLVFTQYDRHAILEEIFKMSKRKLTTIGSLWGGDYNPNPVVITPSANTGVSGVNTGSFTNTDSGANALFLQSDTSLIRGLSRTEFENQTNQQVQTTAQIVASRKLNYSDQIPPFDLTLVGVEKGGRAARCTIFGIQITQETAGMSSNDLGNSVGVSFVALGVDPWKAVDGARMGIINPVN